MGRFAKRLDRQFKVSLAITAGLTLIIPLVWALWPPDTVARAEEELALGRAAEALTTIDAALPEAKGLGPVLLSLKVGALHELGREDDARAILRQSPYQALFPARDAVLEVLAEGYAAQESDPEILEWLDLVPAPLTDATLRRFANEPPSDRQWGALRYLDVSGRGKALDLPERYAASLQSKSCAVRARAAVRLGELAEPDVIAALRELSESAKEEGKNCGQDEAAAAIRALKRK